MSRRVDGGRALRDLMAYVAQLEKENEALRADLGIAPGEGASIRCCGCGIRLPLKGRSLGAAFPCCHAIECSRIANRKWMAEHRSRKRTLKIPTPPPSEGA